MNKSNNAAKFKFKNKQSNDNLSKNQIRKLRKFDEIDEDKIMAIKKKL